MELGDSGIVVTNDGEILGYGKARGVCCFADAERHFVIVRKYRRGAVLPVQQNGCGPLCRLLCVAVCGDNLGSKSGIVHGGCIRATTFLVSLVRRSRHVGDPCMPETDQVRRRRSRARPVIRIDAVTAGDPPGDTNDRHRGCQLPHPGIGVEESRGDDDVFCLWIANAFLGLFFPSLVAAGGIKGTFFRFGIVGILALIFIYTQVPETRGRTLEALEEDVTTGAIYIVHKK